MGYLLRPYLSMESFREYVEFILHEGKHRRIGSLYSSIVAHNDILKDFEYKFVSVVCVPEDKKTVEIS